MGEAFFLVHASCQKQERRSLQSHCKRVASKPICSRRNYNQMQGEKTMAGKSKSIGTVAILILLTAVLGCSDLIGWSFLTNTKWRAAKFDPEGDSITVDFQSESRANLTLLDSSGNVIATDSAVWSNDYKVVTITWGKGKFQGTVKGKELQGSLTYSGVDKFVPLTLWQE